MKTAKIITSIAFIFHSYLAISYITIARETQGLLNEYSGPNLIWVPFLPALFAIASIVLWWYLKKDKYPTLSKNARLFSIVLLGTAILFFFALPWIVFTPINSLDSPY